MQTNSRDIERLNERRLLLLPPDDLVDTITVPSYENHEIGRKVDGSVSHMNMRNGSVASLTISKRGNRSFAMGVAVCLRESVNRESQIPLLYLITFAYLNIYSIPSVLVSQPPGKLPQRVRLSLSGRKTRSYNTMYWL